MAKKTNEREQLYNFNSQMELLIYKNLCGFLKKRKVEKIKSEDRFVSYANWRKHVESKYAPCEAEQLEGFWRYLNNRYRTSGMINNWWSVFFLPFMITLIGNLLVGSITGFVPQINGLDLKALWGNFFQTDIRGKLILAGAVLVWLLLMIAPWLIISVSLGIFMWKLLGITMENEQEKAFYEDYMEIIKDLLDEDGEKAVMQKSPSSGHFEG